MTDSTHLKHAAAGRWSEILSALADIGADLLDGEHHPCPHRNCGGKDRFRALDDFAQTGAVLCGQCFTKGNGDGISAVQHYAGVDFLTATRMIAEYLGISDNLPIGRRTLMQHRVARSQRLRPSESCVLLLLNNRVAWFQSSPSPKTGR